jgi:selenide, water dikinase
LTQSEVLNSSQRLVGVDTRDDAGVYLLDANTALVQTIDFFAPLVDNPFTYGQIAAANALSDIYAMNAKPLTTLNLVGFPDNELPMDLLGEILAGVADRVSLAGAVNLGGHSVRDAEIKVGLAVTGIAKPEDIIKNVGAKPGDILVLTKPLGTGFVTTASKRGICPDATLQAAVESMIQLNDIGRDAARTLLPGVSAMTDVTGYGLAVHASEMVETTGLAVRFFVDQLPALPGVLELVDAGIKNRANGSNRAYLEGHFRLETQPDEIDQRRVELLFDPQTSGGLLIAVRPDLAMPMVQELIRRGACAAAIVGRIEHRTGEDWVIACNSEFDMTTSSLP